MKSNSNSKWCIGYIYMCAFVCVWLCVWGLPSICPWLLNIRVTSNWSNKCRVMWNKSLEASLHSSVVKSTKNPHKYIMSKNELGKSPIGTLQKVSFLKYLMLNVLLIITYRMMLHPIIATVVTWHCNIRLYFIYPTAGDDNLLSSCRIES